MEGKCRGEGRKFLCKLMLSKSREPMKIWEEGIGGETASSIVVLLH